MSEKDERREVEKALRESEQFLMSLFESIQEGISVLDTDMTIRHVNDVMKQWYAGNLPLEGKKCYECYHNTDKPCDPCPTIRCLESHKMEQDIVPGLPGSPVQWVELSSYPIKDPDSDEVTGVVEFVRDITERKQAEQALRASEELYRDLVEKASVAIIIDDREGNFTYFNETLAEMFGYSMEEMAEQSYQSAIHPEDIGTITEYHGRRMRGEEAPMRYEIKGTRKGGSVMYLEVAVGAVLKDGNNIVGTRSYIWDITERKQTEEAVRESEEKYRILYETSPVGISVSTLDGTLVSFNEMMGSMFGYPPEEMKNTSVIELYHDPSDRFAVLEELKDNGSVRNFEVKLKRMDNSVFHGTLNITPYQLAEEQGLLTVIQDITDRKKAKMDRLALEAQLRQSQKLESIGTLASGVAHEVNNPLMGIINYADLIKSRVKDDSLKEFAEGIVEEGDRLAKIVRNLLSFARQDLEEQLTPIGIEDIVESSLMLTGAVLRKDQITLQKDIRKDLPEISCRSQQIKQVMVNLLTNARDALNQRYEGYDEDKILKITALPIEKDGKDWVRITVEDHGVGIPDNIRDRVFDPFFTTKSRAEGTGLGLSVSYGIITEHDGELSVESNPGGGTRFHVDIPATENS